MSDIPDPTTDRVEIARDMWESYNAWCATVWPWLAAAPIGTVLVALPLLSTDFGTNRFWYVSAALLPFVWLNVVLLWGETHVRG